MSSRKTKTRPHRPGDRRKKLILAAFASLFGLLIGEGVCRVLFEPIDYLKPVVVDDDLLGHKIRERSAGHDAWGYRNASVPEASEIVTIGDSQTYGVAASARFSWPAWLSRLQDRSVYNLALGGYGPVQYGQMLEHNALELDPSIVVAALYLGNDFMDAWFITYEHDAWEALRDPALVDSFAPELNRLRDRKKRASSPIKRARDWLAHHSILYRKADFSPIGQWMHRAQQMLPQDNDVNHVFQDVNGTLVEFRPRTRASALDFEDPRIREGNRISRAIVEKMHERCRARGIRFILALIPTKERVFADYLVQHEHPETLEVVRRLIEREDQARAGILQFCAERGIEVVDTLPALQAVAGEARIYPRHTEGHPNRHGYRVIAEAVAARIASGGTNGSTEVYGD